MLDIRGLVAGRNWSSVVTVTDAMDGAVLSVNIGGAFYEVAHLEGVHGLDAAQLFAANSLLV